MRLPTLTLLLLLPAPLVGQRTGALDLRRVRLGTDTLHIEYPGTSPRLRFRLIETLSRPTGRDAGTVRQVMVATATTDDGLTSVDTVLADAATLAFRRSSTVRFARDGRELYRATVARRGRQLISDAPGDSGRTVTTTPLAPGIALLTLPTLALRSAPLTRGWRATMTFRVPSDERPLRLTVDSVTTASAQGRRVWIVHTVSEDRFRLRYVIDSASRDMIELAVRDSVGTVVSTTTSDRYHRAEPLATTGATPADVARVAGHYYLEGEREVGSELLLRPDGTYEFILAYGALDQEARGTWRMHGADVVLTNAGKPGERDLLWFEHTVAQVEPGMLRIAAGGRTLTYVRH